MLILFVIVSIQIKLPAIKIIEKIFGNINEILKFMKSVNLHYFRIKVYSFFILSVRLSDGSLGYDSHQANSGVNNASTVP